MTTSVSYLYCELGRFDETHRPSYILKNLVQVDACVQRNTRSGLVSENLGRVRTKIELVKVFVRVANIFVNCLGLHYII